MSQTRKSIETNSSSSLGLEVIGNGSVLLCDYTKTNQLQTLKGWIYSLQIHLNKLILTKEGRQMKTFNTVDCYCISWQPWDS